jgi:type IV pilus assembly protein PilY1
VTSTVKAIITGAQPWFTAPYVPSPPNLPVGSPFPPPAPLTAYPNIGATAVDDLWHATVNARGKFVYAKTPLEVAYGLGSILAGISNNRKARVGASFSGRALSATNNYVFQATIEPGWTGELKRVRVDPTTAVELPYASPPDWSAAQILNNVLATPAVAPALDANNPWFANRRVVTRNAAGTAVPFRYANLSASQLATLAPTAIQQQKIISYLRGGSTFGNGPTPQVIEGTNIGQFRKRISKLGDLSNSKPTVIGKPNNSWADPGYAAYKTAQASRSTRIFVGSNDGMLHSFDADTGDEVFAYVPSALFTSAKDDGGKFDRGIHALTYQDGGAPISRLDTGVCAAFVSGRPRAIVQPIGTTRARLC